MTPLCVDPDDLESMALRQQLKALNLTSEIGVVELTHRRHPDVGEDRREAARAAARAHFAHVDVAAHRAVCLSESIMLKVERVVSVTWNGVGV